MTDTANALTDEQVNKVAAGMQMLVAHLVRVEGLPLAAALAAAHAEIITAIASVYGGDMAAHCARAAADRVEDLPSLEEFVAQNPLAAMTPQGSA